MNSEMQAELHQAIQQAVAQLDALAQGSEGDMQVAIEVAQKWLEGINTSATGAAAARTELPVELVDRLNDPAARAWMRGWMATPKDALPHIEALYALDRQFAALGLADRKVRALRQEDPDAAVSLGDAVLAWPTAVVCAGLRASLEVTVAETALISGHADGAERMRVALHAAHLRGHWQASFQGAVALSMAAERSQLLARAVELAHNARSIAVQHRDGQRYLVAMQRLMVLAEAGGAPDQAYELALRARGSLEKLQGRKGRQLGDELLAGLSSRWGDEVYDSVRAAFLEKNASGGSA